MRNPSNTLACADYAGIEARIVAAYGTEPIDVNPYAPVRSGSFLDGVVPHPGYAQAAKIATGEDATNSVTGGQDF